MSSMPSINGGQSSHASVQFLNSVLSQRGPNALPYDEGVKWHIRQHLLIVIQDFPGLQVKTANFTHNDGRTVNLLQADGTIPMYYQDVKYNIPITMWLLEAYPKNCPLVYVTPTRDMIIKPRHSCVDASGMTNIPYMQQWVFPRSNLVELVQSLSLLFGQDPPLYSRPATMPARPPPTISPATSFHGLNPMHASAGSAAPAAAQPTPSSGGFPATSGAQIPPYRGSAAYPRAYGQQNTPAQSVTQAQQQNPPARALNPVEVFKRNAVNSLSDRVVRDTNALLRQGQMEMDGLFHTQALLNKRAEQVDEGRREMQEEREGLEQQLQLLLTNTDVIETWLKINDHGLMEVDIDDVFETADVFSKQMLDCTSADLAIEDILYALDRAVRDGAVPFEAYIKHVRMLSREQFIFRATCAKVREVQMQVQISGMVFPKDNRGGRGSLSSGIHQNQLSSRGVSPPRGMLSENDRWRMELNNKSFGDIERNGQAGKSFQDELRLKMKHLMNDEGKLSRYLKAGNLELQLALTALAISKGSQYRTSVDPHKKKYSGRA